MRCIENVEVFYCALLKHSSQYIKEVDLQSLCFWMHGILPVRIHLKSIDLYSDLVIGSNYVASKNSIEFL
jgi:hypothetical protein